jgi:light-regulated signal transduction histidine kinase (bacteriophytochrome)
MPTPEDSYDEIRRLEGEVRKARRDLELFARVLAHDLKEPLRTINAFTQLLAQHAAGNGEVGQTIEWATMTQDATAVIARLVDGLSRYSAALQTGGRPFSPTPTDAVLAIALRRLESAIQKTNAQVSYQSLPVVAGDPDRLCEVFEQLVDNALKYSRSVPPVIEISAVSNQEDCTFTVEDNGSGIAPEYHERIFMPFKRLHGREYPGVGLGLPICKEIVEKHGGRIWLDSGASGSKFMFTLPRSRD